MAEREPDDATRRHTSMVPTHPPGWSESPELRRFRLQVVEGLNGEALQFDDAVETCAIGAHPSNDLVLRDDTVSRFHCEVRVEERGIRVVDLGSRNGTVVDGVPVNDAWLRDGSLLTLGNVELRLRARDEGFRLPLSEAEQFGALRGRSAAMRAVFAVLERAAPTDLNVLITGETGTGKELAAEALHEEGPRREGPFVVVDCGAIPSNLMESELFGHEKGAFTGATERRIGAFEAASGGTVFLDEIGELPTDLQPKLLRVLEQRTIRRLGSMQRIGVDVRVVAATHRDLRAEVNAGRFRSDLYYRLAVVRVELPPLRSRTEDIPLLSRVLLERAGASDEELARLTSEESLDQLRFAAWPGNVRELRNHLERARVFGDVAPAPGREPPKEGFVVDASVPYAQARRRVLDTFERRYAEAIVERFEGRVTKAAKAAGITRVYLHRLLRRHGINRD